MKERILITGVTGQDGSILTRQYLEETDAFVYGLVRRSSTSNLWRIEDSLNNERFEVVEGDITDMASLIKIFRLVKPDKIYSLASQSHVRISFEEPIHTLEVTGKGPVNIYEAARNVCPNARIYQASSSVSGDTKVLVKIDGKIMLIPIKSLVINDDNKTYYDNLECLSVDDDYKIKWCKSSYVFKHVSDDLFLVRGSGGLEIEVTGNHSVIILDKKGNFLKKKIEDLEKSNFLISFTDDNSSNYYPSFDLSMFGNNPEYITRSNCQINTLGFNNDIFRLVGYYIAEGNVFYKEGSQYKINFTFGIKEKDFVKDVRKIVKDNFNIDCHDKKCLEKNVWTIGFCSRQFATFILNNFKTGAHDKIIPSWMYGICYEGFINFMRGYMGDSYERSYGALVYTSCNKDLIENICYLSKLNGLEGAISRRLCKAHKSKKVTIEKDRLAYDLIFHGYSADKILGKYIDRKKYSQVSCCLIDGKIFSNYTKGSVAHSLQGKKSISKQRVLKLIQGKKGKNFDILEKICKSGLHIVRIKEIHKLNKKCNVYDLHVPETQRFIGGNYPILLHNSEMMGDVLETPQTEKTPFNPVSPYAASKVYAHHMAEVYRRSYNMFISCGILYNHESELRGENFVTRKITKGIANIIAGNQKTIKMGNLEAKRDWGYAPDYCRGQKLILEYSKPDDFILATGITYSVNDFLKICCGLVGLDWKKVYEKDERFMRPAEVNLLKGDASKAKNILGWVPTTPFGEMVEKMLRFDFKLVGLELDEYVVGKGVIINARN